MVDQEHSEYLAHLVSSYPDVEVPDVQFVEFSEFDDAGNSSRYTDCVTAAGYEEYLSGGSVNGILSPEESQALNLAMFTCSVQFPQDPRASGWMNDAQLGYLYDYHALRTLPCLKLRGYSVTPPPERSDFIAQGGWSWSPFINLRPALTPRSQMIVDGRCPPLLAEPYEQFMAMRVEL